MLVEDKSRDLLMRKPLQGSKDEVSSLMMVVIDSVEMARTAAHDARARSHETMVSMANSS